MKRRSFLFSSAAVALLGGTTALWRMGAPTNARAESFEVIKTEEEWRALLSDAQYAVLREEDTEPAGTSPLNNEKRKGTFHCAGCDLPLYPSETKYESGTGWPSFWDSLPGAIGTKEDNSLFMTRTEVHCRRCGGHLGHIFDDGPPPTGKRHCLNGLALTFKPATA
jgi:peptide-methionine (R)-S-oxide reductase